MGLATGADRPSGLGYRDSDYVFRQALRGHPGRRVGLEPRGLLGIVVSQAARGWK